MKVKLFVILVKPFSTVRRVIQNYLDTGSLAVKPRCGRLKKLMQIEERKILLRIKLLNFLLQALQKTFFQLATRKILPKLHEKCCKRLIIMDANLGQSHTFPRQIKRKELLLPKHI
ncbi:hypothetical protein X975_26093, partial [Stegodyphus mimosarum]